MTNTEGAPGAHRTDKPFGIMIRTDSHRHGTVDPSAGAINAQSWRHLAAGARLDAEHARAMRAIRKAAGASS